jgi:maltose O-acetyltransferase
MERLTMFYRLLSAFFKIFVYSNYYRKYDIDKSFRFNGYFIRINGNGSVKAGKNSYISFYSYINVIEGSELVLGDNVSIAHNVKIYTSTFSSEVLVKTAAKEIIRGDVTIGNNVLIGSNCFINPGVSIGDNVVIGANSVVTKSLLGNAVYAGSPAKKIREFV